MSRRTKVLLAIVCVALLGGGVALRFRPRSYPPIPIGRETTYLTSPVTKNGTIDYKAAVEAMASEGVTSENNIAVLLLRALGKGTFDNEAWLCERLGIDPTSLPATSLVPYEEFLALRGHAPVERLTDDSGSMTVPPPIAGPWTTESNPDAAAWLEQHAVTLAELDAAVDRTRYFVPLTATDRVSSASPGNVALCMVSGDVFDGRVSSLTNLLLVRAMWHLGADHDRAALDDVAAAWSMLHVIGADTWNRSTSVACLHRFPDVLQAFAAVIEQGQLSASEWHAVRNQLRKLPTPERLSERRALESRLLLLDCLRLIQTQGDERAWEVFGIERPFPGESLDLEAIAREVNRIEDLLAKASERELAADRLPELERIKADLRREFATANAEAPHVVAKYVFAPAVDPLRFLDFLGLYEYWVNSDDVVLRATRAVIDTSLSAAAFRADQGRLPDSLGELVPDYFDEVPTDPADGKPLRFLVTEDAVVIYSIGLNVMDEGGECDGPLALGGYPSSASLADDIALRLPRREPTPESP